MTSIIRNSKEFGEAIRKERLKNEMRQVDLARKASVRQALISELENGATKSKIDTIFKVLAALEMDLEIAPRKKTTFDPTVY
jgi:HTH-type transcriptional regulator/antitoxin HipB